MFIEGNRVPFLTREQKLRAGWKSLDWTLTPEYKREHIRLRLKQRAHGPKCEKAFYEWVKSGELVPPGPWFHPVAGPFETFNIVGEGPAVRSIRDYDMGAKGVRAKLLRPDLGICVLESSPSARPPVLAGMKSADAPKPIRFGTVQADLPEDSDAYEAVLNLRDEIDPADLDGMGVKTGPIHITVRYGIQTEDTSTIEAYLSTLAPIEARLGKTSSFEPSESSDNAAVLIAPVECPELIEVNEHLADVGDFKAPDFEYHPHVTIAYLKPGTEEKYVGSDVTEGTSFTIREVTVITPAKNRKTIALNGASARPSSDFETSFRGEGSMGETKKRAKLLRRGATETPQEWLDKALARPDAQDLYLHGSKLDVFDKFRQPNISQGQLLFFSKLTPNLNLDDYFGDNLYLCKIAPGKLFDPATDPEAQKLLTRLLGKESGGLFGKKRTVLRYEDAPNVILPLAELGYNRFRVLYERRQRMYDAVADANLVQIVDTRAVDWKSENAEPKPKAELISMPEAPDQEERRVASQRPKRTA